MTTHRGGRQPGRTQLMLEQTNPHRFFVRLSPELRDRIKSLGAKNHASDNYIMVKALEIGVKHMENTPE